MLMWITRRAGLLLLLWLALLVGGVVLYARLAPPAEEPARTALSIRRDAAAARWQAIARDSEVATDRRIAGYVEHGAAPGKAARRAWAMAHRDQFVEAEFADAMARARLVLDETGAQLAALPPPAPDWRAAAVAVGLPWLALSLFAGWRYTRRR